MSQRISGHPWPELPLHVGQYDLARQPKAGSGEQMC
jgi:hypothetical protein